MARSDTIHHIARLDYLVTLLKADEFQTVQALANTLGISSRTLHRDLDLLRERGLPIDSDRGRGGGVRLQQSWGIGKLTLSNSEAIDLFISLAIAEKMNSPVLMENLTSIRHKLLALMSLPQKQKMELLRERIRIGGWASPTVLSSFEKSQKRGVEAINRAFLFSLVLNIQYRDGKNKLTDRAVEPHYMYLNYPVWYVLAWDHLRSTVRTFRSDRIEQAQASATPFRLRPFADFEELIDKDILIIP